MKCNLEKLNSKQINKIIISRTDKIGDLVLSIPSFSIIKKMFPEAALYVLVNNYNYEIVKNFPFIDEVIKIDDYNKNELYKKIEDIKADVFIALYSNNDILKLALKSMAKYKIGPLSKPLSFFIYNYGIRQNRSKSIKNEAEYNLDLIRQLNPALFEKCDIEIDKIIYDREYEDRITNFLNDNNISDFILINPFSGGSAKNLKIDEYIKVINKINEKLKDKKIVLMSSLSDRDNAEYIIFRCANIYKYVATSILEIVALIDKCNVYVGVSTGPSHIAGNLKKKCVCIYPKYKSLSYIRWGLYGNDENTSYIVPDENYKNSNYKSLFFPNIDDIMINKIADCIVSKVNG